MSPCLLISFIFFRLTGLIPAEWDKTEEETAKNENRRPRPDPQFTVSEKLLKFATNIYTIIDVIAILPTYIELAMGGNSNSATSFIRILRVFRILKLAKGLVGIIAVFYRAMIASLDALMIMAFSFVIAVVICGCIMFICEAGHFVVNSSYPDGAFVRYSQDNFESSVTPYDSIPSAMYWAVITLTTVGYGDMYPFTRAGRGFACLAALMGIIVISMPVTVLGNNFAKEYDIYTTRVAVKEKAVENERRTEMIRQSLAVGASSGGEGISPLHPDSQIYQNMSPEMIKLLNTNFSKLNCSPEQARVYLMQLDSMHRNLIEKFRVINEFTQRHCSSTEHKL